MSITSRKRRKAKRHNKPFVERVYDTYISQEDHEKIMKELTEITEFSDLPKEAQKVIEEGIEDAKAGRIIKDCKDWSAEMLEDMKANK